MAADFVDAPIPQLISTIVNELVALECDGKLRGIAVVIVKEDGDLRTLTAYNMGAKLPLLAGTSVLHQEMLHEMRPIRDGGCDAHPD